MRKLINLLLITGMTLAGCDRMQNRGAMSAGKHQQVFERTITEGTITKTESCRYLLLLPKGYGKKQQNWVMIIFLHGAGKRPDNLKKIWTPIPPNIPEVKKNFQFIVVYPQCPKDNKGNSRGWSNKLLFDLVNDITSRHYVDKKRIYVTGLSMGGTGAWDMACTYPDLFAAIAPVCGWTQPEKACGMKNVPVWAFHGAKDPVVPLEESKEMVEAVKACGGNTRLTIYPNAGHNAWTQTYYNKELYQWFLKHAKIKERN
jgi:predicted peptidase